MGGKVLAGIFERLAKNMRHVRGGVPDLVVWNTDTKKVRVSAHLFIHKFVVVQNFLWKFIKDYANWN